jgi:RNA-directed DNA polymerase
MEVDHVIPLAYGGKNVFHNLQLLHRPCHDQKTTRDFSDQRCE